jgi:uncharacterized protein (DUF362 family)
VSGLDDAGETAGPGDRRPDHHLDFRRVRMRRTVGLATGSVALAGALLLLINAGQAVFSDGVADPLTGDVPPPAVPPAPATVAIRRTAMAAPSAAEIEMMVRSAVARAGGLAGVVEPGHRVAIKPNLVNDNVWSPAAPTGVTTDPRVVASVVKLAKEAGASVVTIVEGTAGPADWNNGDQSRTITWNAYKNCGYDADADRWFDFDPTVPLIDLNDAGTGGLVPRPVAAAPPNTVKIHLDNGVIRTDYFFPKAVLKPAQGGTCDVLITVPTMKNHGNGNITLALKNHVGIAPSDIYHDSGYAGHPNQMKRDLAHMWKPGDPFPRNVSGDNPGPPPDENTCVHYTVVDLNLVRPSDFAVVDGLVGITSGPVGTTRPDPLLKLIMAGRDPVAVDTVGALVMGYDPLAIPQIGWAWNRGLGNRDTATITVVGDHVAPIRADVTGSFPAGYGGGIKVGTAPPALAAMTPADGATVTGDVTVMGSGISEGVVKAELTVTPAPGPNLLVNGDFEQGDAGWTAWREEGHWGSGEAYDFNAVAETGHGNRCLRLSAQTGSFGVFQQVAVTAGRTYRIDAYWKGKKVGLSQWYEILLIDGPFSIEQADCDPCGVRDNYMYAFDKNTYGLDVPVGNYFGWVWAHQQNAPPANRVDWNNRAGLRTASGNVLTVVLKCGACCGTSGPEAWFDDVSLVEMGTERLVDVAVHPGDPFSLVWRAGSEPPGSYDLKTTVYDVNLNEASLARRVYKAPEEAPAILAQPAADLDRTVQLGYHPDPAVASLTVANGGFGTLNYAIRVDFSPPVASPWLSLDPPTGSSTGAGNVHAITYSTGDLPPGTYVADVIVVDNGSTPAAAYNSPQTIRVTVVVRPVKADFNRDGYVDQSDFGHLQACFTGPGLFVTDPACMPADLNRDNDVDQNDLGWFKLCFTSGRVLAPPGCDGTYP